MNFGCEMCISCFIDIHDFIIRWPDLLKPIYFTYFCLGSDYIYSTAFHDFEKTICTAAGHDSEKSIYIYTRDFQIFRFPSFENTLYSTNCMVKSK